MSLTPERDETLSRLYREAPQAEPPARVDAAVLAAARRAAAPRPGRQPWWRRWAIPLSVTAVALLSASLTLLVSREPEQAALPPPAAPAAATRDAPAAAGAAADPRQQDAPATLPPQRAAPAAPPLPPAQRQEKVSPGRTAGEARPVPFPDAGFAPDPGQAREAGPAPGPWIERIRGLLREGRQAEALRELRSLTETHPDLALPPDLAQLTRR